MSDWQPIESAPREQWLLVSCDGEMHVAQLTREGYEWYLSSKDEDDRSVYLYYPPQFWMPLPKPPSA